jgi:hypothetical protein
MNGQTKLANDQKVDAGFNENQLEYMENGLEEEQFSGTMRAPPIIPMYIMVLTLPLPIQ